MVGIGNIKEAAVPANAKIYIQLSKTAVSGLSDLHRSATRKNARVGHPL